MLSSAQNYATNQPVTVVMLLRGPFVAPQLLSKSSAATLSTTSAASIAHGAGNTMLILTGSNILPGVAPHGMAAIGQQQLWTRPMLQLRFQLVISTSRERRPW